MSMLANDEQTTLRHWLGLMMDAEEPDAMIGCLKRIAERKAHSMLNFDEAGMFTRAPYRTKAAEARWFRLLEALEVVQREMKMSLG